MKKFNNYLYNCAFVIAGTAIGLACLVVILQVFVRYFLGFSFSWGDEATRYFMICGTFIGMGCAYRKGMLTAITVITDRLPERIKNLVSFAGAVWGLLFLTVVVVFAMKQIMSPFIIMQKSPAIRLPMYVPYLLIPIGSVITVSFILEDIIKTISRIGGGKA